MGDTVPPRATPLAGRPRVATPPQPNLLVVSDLHLGLAQHAARSDSFATWLDRLSAASFDRPWRLVLAGDIFEFLHLPPPGGEPAYAEPPDLRVAALKYVGLREVLEPALAALGRFVAAGHDVHFIVGNHDRELILRPVRRMLVRDVLRHAAPTAGARRRLARRVVVHPWFYFEPGVVHIEHGHQFDEFSSYSDVLLPHPEPGIRHLEEPVAHQAVRHFMYSTRGLLDPEDGETWGFFDFVRWSWQIGPARALRFGRRYVKMMGMLLAQASRTARHPVEPTARALRSLRGHARRYGVDAAALLQLRRFWHRPAAPLAVLRCFFGDRILLVALAAALAVGFGVGLGASVQTALALPGIGLLAAGAWLALDRHRSVAQHPRLLRASRRIRDTLGVPLVVFGHSHVAARLPLPGGGVYLNPGGWADEAEREPGAIVLLRRHDGSLDLASADEQPARARGRRLRGRRVSPLEPRRLDRSRGGK